NSGAFDQDVLASPVWALARIGTFMGRLSTQSNSLPIGRQYNKRESLRMGPLSDAEPMREGESIWEKGGLRAFKNQWRKGCTAVVGALRPELFVVLAGMQVNESHPLASKVLTPL
ncbi:hypothetical protein Tco_1000060, partial [Tanacetum coccineum]